MQKIKLQSSDKVVFETDIDIAKCSGTIRTMLEDCGYDNNAETIQNVPVANIHSSILKRILDWAAHHRNDPLPGEDEINHENRSDDLSQWDTEFLKVDQGTLYEIILAANYLDMKGLLDATCKTVANLIKDKTPLEIRKTFNIKNDFTPTEEEEVRRENSVDEECCCS